MRRPIRTVYLLTLIVAVIGSFTPSIRAQTPQTHNNSLTEPSATQLYGQIPIECTPTDVSTFFDKLQSAARQSPSRQAVIAAQRQRLQIGTITYLRNGGIAAYRTVQEGWVRQESNSIRAAASKAADEREPGKALQLARSGYCALLTEYKDEDNLLASNDSDPRIRLVRDATSVQRVLGGMREAMFFAHLVALYYVSLRNYEETEKIARAIIEVPEYSLISGASSSTTAAPDLASKLRSDNGLSAGKRGLSARLLVDALILQGKFGEARSLIKRVLASDIHLDTSQDHDTIDYEMREYGFPLATPAAPPNSQTAIDLETSALINESDGRYDDAEMDWITLTSGWMQWTVAPQQIANAISNLARARFRQGKFEAAIPLVQQAIRLTEQGGSDASAYLINLGEYLIRFAEIRKASTADSLYAASNALQRAAFNGTSSLGPGYYRVKGLLQAAQGDIVGAKANFSRAVALAYKDSADRREGSGNSDLLNSLDAIITFYTNRGDLQHAQEAIKRYVSVSDRDGPVFGSTYFRRSLLYLTTANLLDGSEADAASRVHRLTDDILRIFSDPTAGTPSIIHGRAEEAVLVRDLYLASRRQDQKSLDDVGSTAFLAGQLLRRFDVGSAIGRMGAKLSNSNREIAQQIHQQHVAAAELTHAQERLEAIFLGKPFELSPKAEAIIKAVVLKEKRASEHVSYMQRLELAADVAVYGMDGPIPNDISELIQSLSPALRNSLAAHQSGFPTRESEKKHQEVLAELEAKHPLSLSPITARDLELKRRSIAVREALAKLRSAKASFDRLNVDLLATYPALAELTFPTPVPLADIQSLLGPDEAIAVFLTGRHNVFNLPEERDAAFVWLIGHNDSSFRKIALPTAELNLLVGRLREHLDPMVFNPARDLDLTAGRLPPFPVADAYQLFDVLFGPVRERLKGIRTLFVVPDGSLETIPFSILVTAPFGGPANEYRRIPWMARQVATVTLPTVSSLRALRVFADQATRAPAPFIGFGDPTLEGPPAHPPSGPGDIALRLGPMRAMTTDVRALHHLPALPETGDELRSIARALRAPPDTVHLGNQATVPAVLAAPLSRYRVVAFATHASVTGEFVGTTEPALLLTPPPVAAENNDGLLRASLIASALRLNADWVVLSACNTASSDGTPGAIGLSGLTKAFFFAGARALLVSHWSVASEPTAQLTTSLFRVWSAHPGIGRAEALRRAEMQLLDNPTQPRYAHPMYWAPFVVAGEGGAGR